MSGDHGSLWPRVVAATATFLLLGAGLLVMVVAEGIGRCNEDEYPAPPAGECDPSWLEACALAIIGGGPRVAGCNRMCLRRPRARTAPAGFLVAAVGVAMAAAVFLL